MFDCKITKTGLSISLTFLTISKFYLRHPELIIIYNAGMKTLLRQGISEQLVYGYLVNKLKGIVEKPYIPDPFKNTTKCYKRVV